MIPTLLTLAALSAPTQAARFSLERVELLSDDTGMWLNYDVPMIGAHPLMTGLRLVEQTQLVWNLGSENFRLGTSIESQSVTYERGFNVDVADGDLGWYGGLSTRLFLPRGVMLGVDWQKKRWRLAAGTAVTTAATWRHPSFKVWSVLPTISVALLTGKQDGGKRFRSEPVDRSQFRMDEAAPEHGAPDTGEEPPLQEATPDMSSVRPASGSVGTTEEEGGPRVLPDAPAETTDTTRVLPSGGEQEAAPTEVELPSTPAVEEEAPTEAEVTAPTGPTAVEFSGPTQVLLPGSGPVEVIIGGGEDQEEDDDSSQPGDTKDDGD